MYCSWCGGESDVHEDGLGSVPVAGDISICFACAGMNIFTDDGKLRRPTLDEAYKYEHLEDVQWARNIVLSASNTEDAKEMLRRGKEGQAQD